MTPLEAMACSVPILVGNQDGSKEAVEEGVNGFVLDPFNLDAQAAVLEKLIVDEALRGKMGRGGVQLARNQFSYERFLESHRSFYRDVVGLRNG